MTVFCERHTPESRSTQTQTEQRWMLSQGKPSASFLTVEMSTERKEWPPDVSLPKTVTFKAKLKICTFCAKHKPLGAFSEVCLGTLHTFAGWKGAAVSVWYKASTETHYVILHNLLKHLNIKG